MKLEELSVWECQTLVQTLTKRMKFKITTNICLRKRLEYSILLMGVFNYLYGKGTVTDTVRLNMTTVGTVPIDLTLAGNDTAISAENNESTHVVPQDVAINTTEEMRLMLPDNITLNVIPKIILLIPKELSEEKFTTYRDCYNSLVQFCGSKGFGPRYLKSKENKQNKIHHFRCEFGKVRNGTRKQSSTNTHDKNRECPWR